MLIASSVRPASETIITIALMSISNMLDKNRDHRCTEFSSTSYKIHNQMIYSIPCSPAGLHATHFPKSVLARSVGTILQTPP